MKSLVFVFLGGGLGSSLRFLISKYLNMANVAIPYGTLTVNVIGSFILGFVLGLTLKPDQISNTAILFFATGFCGGFTTFSTFAFENQMFLKTGDYFHFALYSIGSLLFGFSAVFAGIFLSKYF
ncbi:MAG: fluoride efflux transporter CrcB [Gillisia sp.]